MISPDFKNNVQLGDIFSIRSALVDYLIVDRTFAKFNEALEYAERDLQITVPFAENAAPMKLDGWDEDYLNLAKVGLLSNFSEERINHLKSVIKAVLPTAEASANEILSEPASIQGKESLTGRKVISEERSYTKVNSEKDAGEQNQGKYTQTEVLQVEERPNSSKRVIELGPALIVGGAAIAVAGAAAGKAIIVGAGALAAGAGCIITIKK